MEETQEKTPEEQLDYFCSHCWDNEYAPKIMFQALWESFIFHLSHDEMKKIIPQLVAKSKHYPQMIYLAENLFKRLTEEDQKQLDIYPVDWTSDDRYTVITKAEYALRKQSCLPCKCVKLPLPENVPFEQFPEVLEDTPDAILIRPSDFVDFLCFQKVTEMMLQSNSEHLVLA